MSEFNDPETTDADAYKDTKSLDVADADTQSNVDWFETLFDFLRASTTF